MTGKAFDIYIHARGGPRYGRANGTGVGLHLSPLFYRRIRHFKLEINESIKLVLKKLKVH